MAAKREVEYRFLLVGKSGSGKSSTANNIMGENLFPTSTGLNPCTVTCEIRKSSRPQKGVTFRIADTPGLFAPDKSNKEIADQIFKASANLHPGLHAVLYVLTPDCYAPEEQEMFNQLKEMFDSNVVKHIIIIFTKGDELKKKKMSKETLLQQANDHFRQVLQECGNRVIVFNNAKRDSKQTKELLEMVDKIWIENGEMPYSCPEKSSVTEKLEDRVTIRIQERIEKEPAFHKFFSDMLENSKQVTMEAEDLQRLLEDTRKEMTERMIAETAAAMEKEEQERKQKDPELKQLQKKMEKMKLQEEMNQKLAEEKQKAEEEYKRKLKEEKKKYEKEEMEKTEQDIVKDEETTWQQDVRQGATKLAGGAWKFAKGWLEW